jgi:hypothetical protein
MSQRRYPPRGPDRQPRKPYTFKDPEKTRKLRSELAKAQWKDPTKRQRIYSGQQRGIIRLKEEHQRELADFLAKLDAEKHQNSQQESRKFTIIGGRIYELRRKAETDQETDEDSYF